MRLSALLLAVLLLLPTGSHAQRTQFSQDEMKQWLSALASDDMQGRELFTEGLGLAGAYIADRLKEWGVTPAGNNGSYFQTVRVTGVRARSNSSVTVTADGQTRTFRDGQGVTFPRNQGGKQTVMGRVEFVGYGLEFAPLNQNDYAGRDMKGKVALYIGRGSRGMTAVHNRLIGARGRNAIEIHHAIAAGRGVVAGEVPVASVVRAGSVQAFDALEEDDHFRVDVRGRQQLGDLVADLLGGERTIDNAHHVLELMHRTPHVGKRADIPVVEDVLLLGPLQ